MKEPWEWTEDDILSLIRNKVEESTTLEYKACDALGRTDSKKKEISKDVSAFANSAGGTIVYGITENKAHEPEDIDAGYDPRDISGEWLEQVINSNIERRISEVIINTVPLIASRPGKVLYVVYIPESNLAPHMAADDRFYKRFNFQSIAMKEYEVRNLIRQENYPSRDVVCAWRDTVINPLLYRLSNQRDYLEKGKWKWDKYNGGLQGLSYISNQIYNSGNEEEFLELYPYIQSSMKDYDNDVAALYAHSHELFESIKSNSYVLDVYLKAISPESLLELRTMFQTQSQHQATDEAVVQELFGHATSRENHLETLAECIISDRGQMPHGSGIMIAPLWNTYREKLCIALNYPPLSTYKQRADKAREGLILKTNGLIDVVKKTRTELARQYGVPVDTPTSAAPY